MRSILHGFKRTEGERTGGAIAQQDRGLVKHYFIHQFGREESAAQYGPGFYLDFIGLPIRQVPQ
jgi:hypothetical protein